MLVLKLKVKLKISKLQTTEEKKTKKKQLEK